MSTPTSLYAGRRVVVCVGTGGVGKTTVAASLAFAAAAEGRRVLVMTIDPSRRLAQALNIDGANLGTAQVPVAAQTQPGGALLARVLDVQHIFDALVRARASSPQQAKAILNNRIYRHFSASMAGSHEYAAVEALWDAYNDAAIDLIVLDTPPSQHAVDFLEAPERILQFLRGQQRVERVPGAGVAKAVSRKLFDLGGSIVTKAVGKISGAETLQDVLAFLHALSDMYDSFRERAEGVGKLLRQQDVAFLLVGAPTPAQLSALAHFSAELKAHGVSPTGFVLNRIRPDPLTGDAATVAGLHAFAAADAAAASDVAACADALGDESAVARRHASLLTELVASAAPVPVWALQEMAGDADSRRSLETLAQTLRHTQHS